MLIDLQSSTLLLPTEKVAGCRLYGCCLCCRTGVEGEVSALWAQTAKLTVGQLILRLVCSECGTAPVGLKLAEPAAAVEFEEDDPTFEPWLPAPCRLHARPNRLALQSVQQAREPHRWPSDRRWALPSQCISNAPAQKPRFASQSKLSYAR